MIHKNRKKSRIFMFLSTGCSLLKAEGFSCSLGVLYGRLGISKLQFLIKKVEIKFPAINFFQFQVIKPWIRDPDPESGSGIRKNAGSGSALNQPWYKIVAFFVAYQKQQVISSYSVRQLHESLEYHSLGVKVLRTVFWLFSKMTINDNFGLILLGRSWLMLVLWIRIL